MVRLLLLCALCLAGRAVPAQPLPDPVGPRLAAASNFGQAWRPNLMAAALAAGITDFRDELFWFRIEGADGRIVFDEPMTLWPDRLAEGGGTATLLVNNGNAHYDDGDTPHTPEGIAAFARATAETVRRFPAIRTVEVGNEFNSEYFVTGPVAAGDMEQRAEGYLALLRATHAAVKAVRPEVQVLGGGVHSIPVAYLERLFALGMAEVMDGLAFHPYTTPPEQIGPQLAVLRRIPGAGSVPLEATEFGDPDPVTAPDTLLKYYCAFALNGVTRAVWYPLHPRGDGLAPLLTAQGMPTDVQRAHARIRDRMEGRPVAQAAPDPFTQACLFEDRVLVIWGAPRPVTLAPGLRAVDARGEALPAPLVLSRDRPMVILSDGPPVALGSTVTLAPQRVVADSYDQFRLPLADAAEAEGDGFARFARQGERVDPLTTRPGQERSGTFWTPYRASAADAEVKLTADLLLPGWRTGIVHRYTAPEAQRLDLALRLAPSGRSADGVVLTVRQGAAVLLQRPVAAGEALEQTLPGLTLPAGGTLEIVVEPGPSADGDLCTYRFTVAHTAQ